MMRTTFPGSARRCAVCAHPERGAIDAALTTRTSVRATATRFAIAKTVLYKHRGEHLPLDLAQAATEAGDDAAAILRRMRLLEDRAVKILDAAETTGDARTAILALREARSALELLGRNLGLFATRTHVEVGPGPSPERLAELLVVMRELAAGGLPVLVEGRPVALPDGRDRLGPDSSSGSSSSASGAGCRSPSSPW